MGAVAGFIFGYVLGMKQGPDGFANLRQALEEVLGSPDTRALLERLPAMVGMGNGRSASAVPFGEGRLEIGPEQLVSMLRHLADSDAIQSVVAGGLDLARGLFDRFTSRA